MSNYVKNNVNRDEKIVQTAKISFLAILPKLIGLFLIVGIFFGFRYFLQEVVAEITFGDEIDGKEISEMIAKIFGYISYAILLFTIIPLLDIFEILSLEVAVTNKRIIGKKGLFSLTAINIPIGQISNANVSLSFFGRIFHYATIEIASTGMQIVNGNTKTMKLRAIKNAYELLNSINNAIDDNAEEQRRSQAEEIARAMQGKTE